MSYHPKGALNYLKRCIKDGKFNALALIKDLTREDTMGIRDLDSIMIDINLILKNNIYDIKTKLGDEMKTQINNNGEQFDFDLLGGITMNDLNDYSSNNNLVTAIMEFVKSKVRNIVYDIDSDDGDYIKRELKQAMEECENE